MKKGNGDTCVYDIQSHRRAEWYAACKGRYRDADGDGWVRGKVKDLLNTGRY